MDIKKYINWVSNGINNSVGGVASAWGSGYQWIELLGSTATTFLAANNSNRVFAFMSNCFFDGTNYIYKVNGRATRFFMHDGIFTMSRSVTGIAGDPVSFVDVFKTDVDGNFIFGNIHNSTATTNTIQCVRSGTYTPTVTNITNISSSGSASANYLRVGNVVTVSGLAASVDPTSGSTLSIIDISLPISSDLTSSSNCSGTHSSYYGEPGYIEAEVTNNRARLTFTSAAGALSADRYFHFSYLVQ